MKIRKFFFTTDKDKRVHAKNQNGKKEKKCTTDDSEKILELVW